MINILVFYIWKSYHIVFKRLLCFQPLIVYIEYKSFQSGRGRSRRATDENNTNIAWRDDTVVCLISTVGAGKKTSTYMHRMRSVSQTYYQY